MIQSEDVYPSSILRETALRIVKRVPGFYGIPEIHVDADFYMELIDDPHFCYETENEIVFYVRHTLLTDACLASCWFDTEGKFDVRAVLCENAYWFFKAEDGVIRFNFEISGLCGPTRTLYVHTILREPGLTIRLEQNHPGRRAGRYCQEEYPEMQIQAANHYMFASIHKACYTVGTAAQNTEAYINAMMNPYVQIIGHPDDAEIPVDYEGLVLAAKENHVLLEVNSESLHPRCARKGTYANYLILLEYCKKHAVPIVLDSDAHCEIDVGNHNRSLALLNQIGFPEELIINRSVEVAAEYIPFLKKLLAGEV